MPDPIRGIYVEGRLNAAKVIVPDLVSSNGVVQIVDTMLIPPTAELGLSILDRIARTPWVSVYEELILVLGLQPVGAESKFVLCIHLKRTCLPFHNQMDESEH